MSDESSQASDTEECTRNLRMVQAQDNRATDAHLVLADRPGIFEQLPGHAWANLLVGAEHVWRRVRPRKGLCDDAF